MMFKTYRQEVWGYAFYDFANSAVVLLFHSYLLPIYIKTQVFEGAPAADLWWGIVFGCGAIVAALASPWVGRLGDTGRRFSIFRWSVMAAVTGTAVVAAALRAPAAFLLLFIFLSNTLFFLASSIYDGILAAMFGESERPVVSGFSWGFGYVGGVLCLVIVFGLQKLSTSLYLPYVATAAFYLIFSAFSMNLLRHAQMGKQRTAVVTPRELLRALNAQRVRLVIGCFLISDAITGVILFTAMYASGTLRLSNDEIGFLFLIVQVVGFPATWVGGAVARQVGVLRMLTFSVAGWVGVISLLVFPFGAWAFYAAAFLTALVIGTTQALMRVFYAQTVDGSRVLEEFGWYAIATESAAVVAPLLFGGIVWVTGDERIAMSSLAIMAIGGIFLLHVNRRQPANAES